VAGAAELRLWAALLAAETGRVRLLDADEDELVASFDVDATGIITARVVPEGEGARVVVDGGFADLAKELVRRADESAEAAAAGDAALARAGDPALAAAGEAAAEASRGPRASLAIGGALAGAVAALAFVAARRSRR
jgi:hypothetical protein